MKKTIIVIVSIVVVAAVVQYIRFWSAKSKQENGTVMRLEKNYFPFNGDYLKENDKVTKFKP